MKSLPTRECGLKLSSDCSTPTRMKSLPTRECGLKFGFPVISKAKAAKSLPTRECGLKYPTLITVFLACDVTPHAGVWIEMPNFPVISVSISVTPHAGVWIEIDPASWNGIATKSHSPRGSVD